MDQEQRRYVEKELKLMREMVTAMQERNDILRKMLELRLEEKGKARYECDNKFFDFFDPEND